MRTYRSKAKNGLYFLYRIISQVFDPARFAYGIYGYFWFLRDLLAYKSKNRREKILGANLFPMLHDKMDATPFDAHYFHQQLWAFENVLKRKPASHIDIGSTYQLSGYLSKITPTTFVDLRPVDANLANLEIRRGDILHLPFADGSAESLSCLHVAEHIGLGRYGDPINPEGTKLACRELARVLAPGGKLYFSLPIGRPRLCFNAHRVHDPESVISYFGGLELEAFSAVDDQGRFRENADHRAFREADYGCGLFIFTKR